MATLTESILSENSLTGELFDDLVGSGVSIVPRRNVITGTEQNDLIVTSKDNDLVFALGGNDKIIGSRGDDIILGNSKDDVLLDTDTVSYVNLPGPIRLGATGTVDKGIFGFDRLNSIEIIEASLTQGDVIDASGGGNARINVDLSAGKLNVLDIPGIPNGLEFTVTNFEDVVGSYNNDVITGDDKKNSLNGADGDDIINGGGGDDIIAGVDGVGSFPGLGQVDVLTGGIGRDRFILATERKLYYNGKGDGDYAQITDAGNGGDVVFLGTGQYSNNADYTKIFAVNVDPYGNTTEDLIANITYDVGYLAPTEETKSDVLASGNSTFSLAAGESFGIFTANEFA
jgi:Ca2+-binding RTX toxin-like protein